MALKIQKRVILGPDGHASLKLGELGRYFRTAQHRTSKAELQNRGVFINLPYDAMHLRILDAIVFTVLDCGFIPRLAIQDLDHSRTRLEKITNAMAICRFSIHDLSPKSTLQRLPRLNMAFELGIVVGTVRAQREGALKRVMVLDRNPYGTMRTLSDIAGLDVFAHRNRPGAVIGHVRALFQSVERDVWLPSPRAIARKLRRFQNKCKQLEARNTGPLTITDRLFVMAAWLMDEDAGAKRNTHRQFVSI